MADQLPQKGLDRVAQLANESANAKPSDTMRLGLNTQVPGSSINPMRSSTDSRPTAGKYLRLVFELIEHPLMVSNETLHASLERCASILAHFKEDDHLRGDMLEFYLDCAEQKKEQQRP